MYTYLRKTLYCVHTKLNIHTKCESGKTKDHIITFRRQDSGVPSNKDCGVGYTQCNRDGTIRPEDIHRSKTTRCCACVRERITLSSSLVPRPSKERLGRIPFHSGMQTKHSFLQLIVVMLKSKTVIYKCMKSFNFHIHVYVHIP